jgi:RNA-binding protein
MPLSSKQKSYLRGLAHSLKPVVMIGSAGVTEGVLNELHERLAHHELIKVRLGGMDRDDRVQTAQELCQQTQSELVGTIGHIAILYRRGDKAQITLPQ